jgi:hypothetical protein
MITSTKGNLSQEQVIIFAKLTRDNNAQALLEEINNLPHHLHKQEVEQGQRC